MSHGISSGLFENLPVGLGSNLPLFVGDTGSFCKRIKMSRAKSVLLISRECPSHFSWEELKIHALHIYERCTFCVWQFGGMCFTSRPVAFVHNPHFSLISSPYNLVKIAKLVDKPWEDLTREGSDFY